MKQKTLLVEKIDDLKKQLPGIAKEFDESTYKSGTIDMCYANVNENEIRDLLCVLKESFPKLKITGFSAVSLPFYHNMASTITVSFNFYERSGAEVFGRILEPGDDTGEVALSFAKELNEKLLGMKDVKAIGLYLAKIDAATAPFINALSEGLEEIPIFGVVASANLLIQQEGIISLAGDDAAVIAGKALGPGISVCVSYGDELHAYVDYQFGWEPIGRALEVESHPAADRGTVILDKIDGEVPTEIYEKYLGVRPGRHFVNNVGEFPMIVERDGLYMGRMPSGLTEEGEVILAGDVLSGEKIRFSYAERDDILSKTRDAVARMDSFAPETLSLIVCGNRFMFLQDDYKKEVTYYSEGRKTPPTMCLGVGEIYRFHGKGGLLNSALVAVGMREGLEGWSFTVLKPAKTEERPEGVIPLHERLARFLTAMTGELIEAAKDAEAANEAKSNFLSNMSHEIRTPINAILGMDEMILRESNDPQITEYAQNIRTAGNTLLGLVNDILDFSKIEAGKMDIIPVDYDISSVVNDLMQMINPRANAKGLELKFEINTNMPGVLNGDEIRIKQVAANLLTNAVKYTEKGSVTFKVDYEDVSSDEIDVKMTIRDTGIGIRSEDLTRLYGAFQRVDEKRNRTIEGTGLGLNICQKLLKLMGSQLEVKSTYGEGSEFSFSVRQRVVKRNPIGDYMEAYEKAIYEREVYHEKFIAPGAIVLVVDDTPMNLTVFEGLLKKTQIKVNKAESGAECLEMTRVKKYDIIFLDHRMPIMDGVETLEKLRSDPENINRTTPVISLTANAVSGAREFYIEAGFDDYLTKPIMSEKLEAMMMRYLPPEKMTPVIVKEGEYEEENKPEKLPGWLKDNTLIDASEGIKNCGSQEAFINAAESFKESMEDGLAVIRTTFEEKNIAGYTIRVHSLKSSARIIGAGEISKLAAELEAAGDAGDMEKINEDTPKLLALYEELKNSFFAETSEKEEDELPLMDEAGYFDAINTIKELAGSYDYDNICYIMETVKGFRVPEAYRQQFKKLVKAVGAADWDEIKELLEKGGLDG